MKSKGKPKIETIEKTEVESPLTLRKILESDTENLPKYKEGSININQYTIDLPKKQTETTVLKQPTTLREIISQKPRDSINLKVKKKAPKIEVPEGFKG